MILVSAAVVAVVMQRMRLAAIPTYLIAGAVVGPRALGLVPSSEGLGAISHLAIILLLFGIGLELHFSVLKHRLTILDEEAVLRTCAVARRRAPDIFIAARTRVVSKRAGLIEVGADSVTVDETSAASAMLRAVMARLDASTDEEPLGTESESDLDAVSEGFDEDE